MKIRAANLSDKPAWLALRRRLRPALSGIEHERDWGQMMGEGAQRTTLVGVDEHGALLGMVEISRRPQMEGFGSGPVAYVDALQVEPGEQREVSAQSLAKAAARWAQARGCRVLASDTSLENQWEQKLHLELGFEEVARKVVYRMALTPAATVQAVADAEQSMRRPPAPVTPLHANEPVQSEVADDGPAWWPGPVRAAILVVGLVCLYFTDVFSGNVLLGVVLPIVDVVFFIYLMLLFIGMKYRSKTGDGERSIELYQPSNDGE